MFQFSRLRRFASPATVAMLVCLFGSVVAADQHDAANATAAMEVHDDLQVRLFASEPQFSNPSNIDVDHLGRVWVCEIVNYRVQLDRNKDKLRESGDRILILEDTDHDGVADSHKVFYEGRDIDSPHGICVLGNRVIVSTGSHVYALIDDDGDDRADRKEVLFSGIAGEQHDHGIHAFVFGPDGKLYFNFGNEGRRLKDRDGNPVVDLAGNTVSDHGKPYRQGMVFRCDLDGTNVETLGWNFRNNWEVAVDSFGTLWQSDNDDDGNFGTRINFVMEFGNYGYQDEMTGAGWRQPRIGMHEEVPKRHWHLRDPGVVPNVLQTGAGSPSGICVYEGDLLPDVFRNQMIHCEPGKNAVLAYPVTKDGAGYSATIENVIDGKRNSWFRPVDVCVAGDGSLFVADWYDAGVGGHRAADIKRGRIFRVTPKGNDGYDPPRLDLEALSTVAGAIVALGSPNMSTRYLAWETLHEKQAEAELALSDLFQSKRNPFLRARALWLLGSINGRESHYVDLAIKDSDPDIRIVGLRLARQKLAKSSDINLIHVIENLVEDDSPRVRRECAIALRHLKSDTAPQLWARLAMKYDGKDRWYLEALGIGAALQWDACLDAYFAEMSKTSLPEWVDNQASRDIIWRSRAKRTPELLSQMARNSATPESEVPRVIRSFDFAAGSAGEGDPLRNKALTGLILAHADLPATRRSMVAFEAAKRLPEKERYTEEIGRAMESIVHDEEGTLEFVKIVEWFGMRSQFPKLFELAADASSGSVGIQAARVLADQDAETVAKRLVDSDEAAAAGLAMALKNAGNGECMKLLLAAAMNETCPLSVRSTAVQAAATSPSFAQPLMELVRSGELEDSLRPVVAAAFHSSDDQGIRDFAREHFPLPPAKEQAMPEIRELVGRTGDAERGAAVFAGVGTCSKCHIVGKTGSEVGPNLSEIGDKLSRQAMYESILFPSAGISHNYETWSVFVDDGTVATGLKVSQSDKMVSIRNKDGVQRDIPSGEVEEIQRLSTSLMPSDLHTLMTTEQLVDLVGYLESLKKGAGNAE